MSIYHITDLRTDYVFDDGSHGPRTLAEAFAGIKAKGFAKVGSSKTTDEVYEAAFSFLRHGEVTIGAIIAAYIVASANEIADEFYATLKTLDEDAPNWVADYERAGRRAGGRRAAVKRATGISISV